MDFFGQRRALSLIEVVVSMTILVIVLATYASTAEVKKNLLHNMRINSVYKRLADVQLERMLNLIHRNRTPGRQYGSSAKTNVSSLPAGAIFSYEGTASTLDATNSALLPTIPLLRLEVHGTADSNKSKWFLSFPYPEELKHAYTPAGSVTSPTNGTFHNITNYLRTNYPDVLPLVSEEFLIVRDNTQPTVGGRFDEVGYNDAVTESGDQVSLSPLIPIFAGGTAGLIDRELVRRYVYYRKIREGNIVFRNSVVGIKSTTNTNPSQLNFVTTDIDSLYIQHLNTWNTANGSTGNSGITARGSTLPEVGALGAHSIFIMVVVRAAEDTGVVLDDTAFLNASQVKAVSVGIAAPTYNKNLLWTMDLDYHRYNGTRIPGIRYPGL